MKLAELNPQFRRLEGLGECLTFDCPKGKDHRVCVPTDRWRFSNRDDFSKITITPSINEDGCWHGWITGGEVVNV